MIPIKAQTLGWIFILLMTSCSIYAQDDLLDNYLNTAASFNKAGDVASMLHYMDLAKKKVAQDSGSTSMAYIRLENKTGVYLLRNYYHEQALEYFYKVEPIYQKGDSLDRAILYYNMATCLKSVQEPQAALNYFQNALSIFQALLREDHPYIALVFEGISMVHYKLDRYAEALGWVERAHAINLKVYGEKDPLIANEYVYFGNIHRAAGSYEDALKYYKKGLEITAEKDDRSRSWLYADLGNLFIKMKDYTQAEEYLNQALEAKDRLGETTSRDLAWIYLDYAELKAAQGEIEAARNYYQKSLQANIPNYHPENSNSLPELLGKHNAFIDLSGLLSNLVKQMRLGLQEFEANKNLEALNRAMKVAVMTDQLMQKLWQSHHQNSDKAYSVKEAKSVYHEAVKLCYVSYQQKPSLELIGQAFHFMERYKSVLLRNALKERSNTKFAKLPADLKQQDKTLKDKIEEIESQLLGASDSLKISLQNDLQALYTNQKQLYQEIAEKYPSYYNLQLNDELISLETLKKDFLGEQSMLVEYLLTEDALFIIGISKTNLAFQSVDLTNLDLQADFEAFRKMLIDPEPYIKGNMEMVLLEFQDRAYNLYIKLLKDLKIKDFEHLIIVPDAWLNYLPFEVLTDGINRSPKNFKSLSYLLEKHQFSYLYSASLLKDLEQPKRRNGRILAFAPSYSGGKVSELRSPKVQALRKSLTELPGIIEELEALAQIIDGDYFLGDVASEHQFKNKAKDYDFIHLAMHGLVNEEIPILSSLAFSENLDSLEDNFLQAHEIAKLELQAQLVVLSACETGYGSLQEGEGVMSLGRAFMYAGVPSLLVSLWQVNDQSTSIIMQNFYKYLANGQTKSAALRQAKLDYLQSVENPVATHPAFWSPFILIGDDRPAPIAEKGEGSWLWWTIGAAALLLAGIGFSFARRKSKA
jgi:CHAT domain-containing protein